MTQAPGPPYDLCVVGSGMAGLSAALFAADRGFSTALVGRTGEIIFATGLLDLLGVHPVAEGRVLADPWAGIAALKADEPLHPYARIPAAHIRTAFDALTGFLAAGGLPYAGHPDCNAVMATAAGTLKTTYRVPETMWGGVTARQTRSPVLLIDIAGLKGFSARQIAAALGPGWPGIRTGRIRPEEMHLSGEVFPERLARALEGPAYREKLAAAIRPLLGDEAAVGLPAILGVSASAAAAREIGDRIGRPLFEIPTMPPGVAGLRLKETFERGLAAKGVRLCLEYAVQRAAARPAGGFHIEAVREGAEALVLRSERLVLATGRFMGGGLRADRRRVYETLFGLPVHQPAGREDWHREDFLDPRGHPVNRAGIEVDDAFRPLAADGRPFHPRLFAAGAILAHQDWMRMKCGSGLAVATAWSAVQSAAQSA